MQDKKENETERTGSLLGIVISQNCYLYSTPQGGITDEIFSGWAIRVFPQTEEDGWIQAETHYGYLGYIRKDEIRIIDREELIRRQDKESFFRIGYPAVDVLSEDRVQGLPKEVVLKNAIVELLEPKTDGLKGQTGWCRIRTAAGTDGWIHAVNLEVRRDDDGYLLQSDVPDLSNADTNTCQKPLSGDYFLNRFKENPPDEETLRSAVVKSALSYLGTQYRWGGKSSMGLDCSGLTFMSYMENGVLIYRDSKMPQGYPVREISREELKPGDLLFFPGHVAMYLGDGKYIHATGFAKTPCVTINSLNPEDEDYREDLDRILSGCGSVFAVKGPENDTGWKKITKHLRKQLDSIPGNVSIVCKNLSTGENFSYREEEPHVAASVIKIFLMAAVFQGFADGTFSPDDKLTVHKTDCVPSCGVLTYLHGEREVSIRDLVELMIIVSDNTATNLLFDYVGAERLSAFIRDTLGLEKTVFRRKMFDDEGSAKGIENYVTAKDAAWLLEKIYRRELISPEASEEMYRILTHQRLNGKIPFYLHTLPDAPMIAHKTGEDTGVTHDVAVVEGKDPLILCFLGNDTDVPEYERLMAETARDLYLNCI